MVPYAIFTDVSETITLYVTKRNCLPDQSDHGIPCDEIIDNHGSKINISCVIILSECKGIASFL